MASNQKCASCGKAFELKNKKKSYGRKINAKINAIDKTIKKDLEQEYKITISPGGERFLCNSCCWSINTIAKSADVKEKLTESGQRATYLKRKISFVSTKLSSPGITPRKLKRQRVLSPTDGCSTVGTNTGGPKTLEKTELVLKKRIKTITKEAEVAKGLSCLGRRQYSRGISILLRSRLGFKTALQEQMKNELRKEAVIYAKTKSAFTGRKTLEEVERFSWDDVFNDLMKRCPLLTNVLVASLTTRQSSSVLGIASKPSISVKPVIGTIAAIILYLRRSTLCSFQEMNSLQLWLSGTKRQTLAQLNHLGLSVGIKRTRAVIDRIRGQYDTAVLQWKTINVDFLSGLEPDSATSDTIPFIESDPVSDVTGIESDIPMDSPISISPGQASSVRSLTDESQSSKSETEGKHGYSICFDNVNTKVTVRHQTRDRRNKMFNMVQAYAARDRIPTLHLSDQAPSPDDLLTIPLSVYFPTHMDEVSLRFEMTVMVTRILAKHMSIFSELQDNVTWHIRHRYTKQSSYKSEMVPLGVLDKDECKLADAIDILEDYHKYVPLKPNGDPLKIPLDADGLSCERGNDAQCARINGVNAWQQLQGLVMNAQEWHKRCTLLQDVYDELFGAGGRDKGTMFHLKNYFNHRNVTANVKQSFNYNEEFLEFCVVGYIILCAMKLLGVKDLLTYPDEFPSDNEEQFQLLNWTAGKIIDLVFLSCQNVVERILTDEEEETTEEGEIYCICGLDQPGPMIFCENRNCQRGTWFHLECLDMTSDDVPEDHWFCCDKCNKERSKTQTKKPLRKTVAQALQDGKINYVLMLIWRSINQMVRRDAIRENDGERIVMHWKFDMLQFFDRHHPKYFLLGQRLLSPVGGGVCPRLQHTLKWNRTVNTRGGAGQNISMDLQMEYLNKEFKESVKDAAGHLTEATIARHSQMIGIGKALEKIYQVQFTGQSGRTVHKAEEVQRDKDLNEFITLMNGKDFFTPTPGRHFTSFPDFSFSLYPNIIGRNVRSRLQKQSKVMAKKQQVVLQMQNN